MEKKKISKLVYLRNF